MRPRTLTHIVLFVVAFSVLYVGLGVGLTRDPNLGTALWGLARVIVLGNLFWVYKSRPQK